MSEQKFIDDRELARRLGVSRGTLQLWRSAGREDTPPYVRIGHAVRYDWAEVTAWLKTRRVGGE
jgi:predicted DNA-binding transcriptional regulator AlpA